MQSGLFICLLAKKQKVLFLQMSWIQRIANELYLTMSLGTDFQKTALIYLQIMCRRACEHHQHFQHIPRQTAVTLDRRGSAGPGLTPPAAVLLGHCQQQRILRVVEADVTRLLLKFWPKI